MRFFTSAAILALGLSLATAATAQSDRAAPPAAPGARADESSRRSNLDELFDRLAKAKDETEAKGVAGLIERRWARSGSDTADLLMSRAGEAIKAKDHALAIELLDRILVLKPDWAEAWNKRALAFYMIDDPASSMADLAQVLKREPRHFSALAGLGQIYLSGGDKRRALDAFRRALAIHPHLESVQKSIDQLVPDVDGRDI